MLSYLLCATEAIQNTKKKVGHVLRLGTRLGIFSTETERALPALDLERTSSSIYQVSSKSFIRISTYNSLLSGIWFRIMIGQLSGYLARKAISKFSSLPPCHVF